MLQDVLKDNIIAELNLKYLPYSEQVLLVNKIITLVEKRLLVRLSEILSAQDLEELGKVIEKNDQALINAFIQEKVPNFYEIIDEEVLRVKQELKDFVEKFNKEN